MVVKMLGVTPQAARRIVGELGLGEMTEVGEVSGVGSKRCSLMAQLSFGELFADLSTRFYFRILGTALAAQLYSRYRYLRLNV